MVKTNLIMSSKIGQQNFYLNFLYNDSGEHAYDVNYSRYEIDYHDEEGQLCHKTTTSKELAIATYLSILEAAMNREIYEMEDYLIEQQMPTEEQWKATLNKMEPAGSEFDYANQDFNIDD